MNILIVSPFSHDVRITPRMQIAIKLVQRGHNVYFVTPREQYVRLLKGELPNTMYENLQGVEVFYFHAIFPIRNLAYPFPDLIQETKLIFNIIEKKEIDIVHFYQPEFLTSIPLPLIKKKFNKPILLTINGFPGVNWFYGTPIVNFVGLIYTQTITRFLMRYADKILLYATNLKWYAKRMGMPEEKMIFLPEGIEVNIPQNINEVREITRKELNVSSNEKLIIFTGRLVPVKGVDILIRAFKILHSKYPSCKLLIVGDGPYRKYYETQSGELLNKAIIFTGLVKPEKVIKFLLASDIFVLPSFSEGIPSSLLEACSCGLPCIATNTGAIPDVIKNAETGIIVKPGDEEELTQALTQLVNDEEASRRMGENARRVRQLFSWNNIVKRYEKICLELIENRGSI